MEMQSQKRQDAQIALALGKIGAVGPIAQAVLRIAAVLGNRVQTTNTLGTVVGSNRQIDAPAITSTSGAPGNFTIAGQFSGRCDTAGTTVGLTLLRNGVAIANAPDWTGAGPAALPADFDTPALSFFDAPGPGTYTYSLLVTTSAGNIVGFREDYINVQETF